MNQGIRLLPVQPQQENKYHPQLFDLQSLQDEIVSPNMASWKIHELNGGVDSSLWL